ncbi:lantibiotic dehydratase [Gordonia sp. NPDC003424]
MNDFFVLRTPLLPVQTLLSLGCAIECNDDHIDEHAVERDRARTRQFLAALFRRSDVAEALHLASPSLSRAFDRWLSAPTERVDVSLLSYASRMTTRATPFGLFAGWSLGSIMTDNDLQLSPAESYRRRSSLDCGYLGELGAALASDPSSAPKLTVAPNDSLYFARGRWRYLRTRRGAIDRVTLVPDVALSEVLTYSRGGVTLSDLASRLRELDNTYDDAEIQEYVTELIAEEVLVRSVAPSVTGPNPVDSLVDTLTDAGAPTEILSPLRSVQRHLLDLDHAPPGRCADHIRAITDELSSLPFTPTSDDPLIRCDLHKPANARLSGEVLAAIRRGVDVLERVGDAARYDPLAFFSAEFTRRYGDREVPLCDALDSDCGIGFPGSPLAREVAGVESIVNGLRFGSSGESANTGFGQRDRLLAGWILDAAREGRHTMVLGDAEIEALDRATPKSLAGPVSCAALITVLAADSAAMNRGDYQLCLFGAEGPSGANLLGRFCRDGDDLLEEVREHLRQEESARPDAIFAEIVHLPTPRTGNVLTRPVLRDYEIPILARSGAPPDRQIALSDLRVSVRSGEITLRSERLGREVIPRLSTAHNFNGPGNIAMYRFLCALQYRGVRPHLSFTLGALDDAPFVPRVIYERYILSRARWNLSAAELAAVHQTCGVKRISAMQTLRSTRCLPRWVAVGDGADRALTVDLANPVFIDVVAHLARKHGHLQFVETFLDSACTPVVGPEGRYLHEIVVPFHRTPVQAPVRATPRHREPDLPPEDRSFQRDMFPGSEWLYLKLYTGPAGADIVLREAIAPFVTDELRNGRVDEWFYVRYGDPDWHLRVRMHGEGARLLGEVLPALTTELGRYQQNQLIWRVQTDTYQRETERYRGAAGMRLAEAAFYADSDAVVDLISRERSHGMARWQLAIVGVDRLLADLGLATAHRYEIVAAAQTRMAALLGVDRALRRELGTRFRQQRKVIDGLLTDPDESVLAPLARRGEALTAVGEELAGTVGTHHVADWISSVMHMHINRVMQMPISRQEFVIYDFLARHYRSVLGRRGVADSGR